MSTLQRRTRLSGLEPLVVTPQLNFINVGERTNVTGSAQFKKMILEGRYDDALVDYLAEKSYSLTYGARNLRRLIQKELEDPMAAKIIDAFEHPITQIGATAKDGAVQLYTL